ncbi:hypothetical protein H072_2385 [Dactylellina haptotyla CBS 200.50]|uniref:Mannan endo-1,6-alpha-mannosidase n=1 Tax=Dactylellina haptotyla (strain CBS 200.50) TaxID=1284197 RepID=S8C761_DACHA|nr:hypothetical protein H072_2385 [Dactylellina haptotyla CBS 200.50]
MRSRLSATSALLASVQLLSLVPATFGQISIDLNSADSLKNAAKTVMKSMVKDYTGQQPFTAGLLPNGYGLFESGLFFNTILDYAAFTGDSSYNGLFEKDFFAQIGPNADFVPANKTEGVANDDVGYWALTAMTAAEYGAKPADSSSPAYLDLAKNVFNAFVSRWDTANCKGGLRWTIYNFQNGYDFKDTNSNGIFFELAARLGAQTGNKTYFDWATKVFDWTAKTGLTDVEANPGTGVVYAGASVQDNCKDLDKTFYSAQHANYLLGCAVMFNATGSQTWLDRAILLTSYASVTYFGPQMYVDDGTSQVVIEQACEFEDKCNNDQKAGKSVLFRSLAGAMRLNKKGEIANSLTVQLNNSAKAAGKSCQDNGNCGFKWSDLKYDPTKGTGFGEKMAAIESWMAIVRRANANPDTAVFQADTSNQPSTTSGSPSGSSSTPGATQTSSTPNSGSKVMAGSALGVMAAISFLNMLL